MSKELDNGELLRIYAKPLTTVNTDGLRAVFNAGRSVSVPTREELADVLMALIRLNTHGQLCPCWTRKAAPAECDCWQRGKALTQADKVLERLATGVLPGSMNGEN